MRNEYGTAGTACGGYDGRRRVELELTPGECVVIGEDVLTVVETEPGVVHVRLDRLPDETPAAVPARFALAAR